MVIISTFRQGKLLNDFNEIVTARNRGQRAAFFCGGCVLSFSGSKFEILRTCDYKKNYIYIMNEIVWIGILLSACKCKEKFFSDYTKAVGVWAKLFGIGY